MEEHIASILFFVSMMALSALVAWSRASFVWSKKFDETVAEMREQILKETTQVLSFHDYQYLQFVGSCNAYYKNMYTPDGKDTQYHGTTLRMINMGLVFIAHNADTQIQLTDEGEYVLKHIVFRAPVKDVDLIEKVYVKKEA